jgi:hypothetical protein
MPTRNSIGAILFIAGLFMSLSLYIVIWFNWPNGMSNNIRFQLHDTHIVLHPIFVLVGVFALCFNLFIVVLQSMKRFRVQAWNATQVFALLILAGFIFYGREVIRFGFILATSYFIKPANYTVHPPSRDVTESAESLPNHPRLAEQLATNLPEIILIIIGLLLIFLFWKLVRNRRLNKL